MIRRLTAIACALAAGPLSLHSEVTGNPEVVPVQIKSINFEMQEGDTAALVIDLKEYLQMFKAPGPMLVMKLRDHNGIPGDTIHMQTWWVDPEWDAPEGDDADNFRITNQVLDLTQPSSLRAVFELAEKGTFDGTIFNAALIGESDSYYAQGLGYRYVGGDYTLEPLTHSWGNRTGTTADVLENTQGTFATYSGSPATLIFNTRDNTDFFSDGSLPICGQVIEADWPKLENLAPPTSLEDPEVIFESFSINNTSYTFPLWASYDPGEGPLYTPTEDDFIIIESLRIDDASRSDQAILFVEPAPIVTEVEDGEDTVTPPNETIREEFTAVLTSDGILTITPKAALDADAGGTYSFAFLAALNDGSDTEAGNPDYYLRTAIGLTVKRKFATYMGEETDQYSSSDPTKDGFHWYKSTPLGWFHVKDFWETMSKEEVVQVEGEDPKTVTTYWTNCWVYSTVNGWIWIRPDSYTNGDPLKPEGSLADWDGSWWYLSSPSEFVDDDEDEETDPVGVAGTELGWFWLTRDEDSGWAYPYIFSYKDYDLSKPGVVGNGWLYYMGSSSGRPWDRQYWSYRQNGYIGADAIGAGLEE